MPDRNRKAKTTGRNNPAYREALAPAMPSGLPAINSSSLRSPWVVYAVFLTSTILCGVLVGLAIRPYLGAPNVAVRTGPVAAVSDAPFARVVTAQSLAMAGAAMRSDLQAGAPATALQPAPGASAVQLSFSGYGLQGSVGSIGAH